jgi:hypothetical protein
MTLRNVSRGRFKVALSILLTRLVEARVNYQRQASRQALV